MALLPFWSDPYIYRPSTVLDQHISVPLKSEDLLENLVNPRLWIQTPAGYWRNWLNAIQDTGSTISCDDDKFQVNVDVQQFKPDEVTVKVTDKNTVTIEGKHEEKPDEHGYISRHFIRKYVLPPNCNIDEVQSKVSSDGVLTITAPKISEGKQIQHREIPIIQTGQPAKLEHKKEEN